MTSFKTSNCCLLAAFVATLLSLACSTSRPVLYRHKESRELLSNAERIAYVPRREVDIRYRDNTRALPDSQFSDTFFIETVNALLKYELSQQFGTVIGVSDDLVDSLGESVLGYSRISGDTTDYPIAAGAIRTIAESAGAELVFVPYSVQVRHSTYQPDTWRTQGPSYERPTSISAMSSLLGQIWGADGTLLYERISVKDAGRPILYNLLRKREPDEDIVRYAKRVYSAPMVKALYRAIQFVIQGI